MSDNFGANIAGGTTELDSTLDVLFENKTVAQFTRFTDTAKWFKPGRTIPFKGKREVLSIYTTPMNNVKRENYATARTSAYPTGTSLSHTRVSWAYTDLAMFRAAVKINMLDMEKENGDDNCVYDLATTVVSETTSAFEQSANLAVHQNADCEMAKVGTKYAVAGGTYSQNRRAYFSLSGATPSRFQKGMLLTINSQVFTVMDVIHGSYGPWSGGTRIASIGPGLTVDAGSGLHCDAITAANVITINGETTGGSFAGLPSWMSGTVNVYADEAGTPIDRDLYDNDWSIPYIEVIAAAGAEEVLDLEDHVGRLADVLPGMVQLTKKARRDQGISISKAMAAIMSVSLVNQSVQSLFDTQLLMSKYGKEESQDLFGSVGFSGVTYNSPTLGPIAFQADPVAAPNTIDLLDPSSWLWFTGGKGMSGVDWEKNGSSRWFPVYDSGNDNRLTHYIQAGCRTAALLACDCPKTNARITGVKSSRTTL
jgi:hypothetical protein